MQLKQILILIIVTLINSVVYSQTEEGAFFIGGSSNFRTSFYEESGKISEYYEVNNNNQFSLEITPQFGYFFADNFVLGISAPLSYSQIKLKENESKQKKLLFAIAPFFRYYFGSKKLKPYIEFLYGLGKESIKNDQGFDYLSENSYGGYSPYGYGYGYDYNYEISEYEEKKDINLFELTGGIAFFISQHISVDFGISYGKIHFSEGLDNKGFSSSLGFNMFFGGNIE